MIKSLFQKFNKLRGAIRYPPKAPYDELPEPISEIVVESVTETNNMFANNVRRPEISDLRCEKRSLECMNVEDIKQLAGSADYILRQKLIKWNHPIEILSK